MRAIYANDVLNAKFWDEACGTTFAKANGITGRDRLSLHQFDRKFFEYYPYLDAYVPFDGMAGKRVLEIGLGYGTVAQRIAECGADFYGLDIAAGPVDLLRARLNLFGLHGEALRGNALFMPFDDDVFDHVVAIGSLHHTGDLARGIGECWRVLKPNGTMIIMVYNAYSYRRWFKSRSRWSTFSYLVRELFGYRGPVGPGTAEQRINYDADSAGTPAPHVDWISVRSLAHMCGGFRSFRAAKDNIDTGRPYRGHDRTELLKTRHPQFWGLDVYATAVK